MSVQVILALLGILGTLSLIALAVNAFFLRGIFSDLGAVKIQLAEISTRSDEKNKAKEKRLDDLEKNEKEVFRRLNDLEKKV